MKNRDCSPSNREQDPITSDDQMPDGNTQLFALRWLLIQILTPHQVRLAWLTKIEEFTREFFNILGGIHQLCGTVPLFRRLRCQGAVRH